MSNKKVTDQRPLGVGGAGALKPDEFGVFLGLASWLLSMSRDHKHLPFSHLDERILPAILLKQFKLIRKDEMPVAFVSWATVSEEIKADLEHNPERVLKLEEWRSGSKLVVVECVSPFAPAAKVKDQFIREFLKTV